MKNKNQKKAKYIRIWNILLLTILVIALISLLYIQKQQVNRTKKPVEESLNEDNERYDNSENEALRTKDDGKDDSGKDDNRKDANKGSKKDTKTDESVTGESKTDETQLNESELEKAKSEDSNLHASQANETKDAAQQNHLDKKEGADSFQIQKITDKILKRMDGKSYGDACDVPLESLRYLRVLYYGFDGETHEGELIVNEQIAEDTLNVLRELYEAEYPIEQMVLVDEYDADDNASMLANNTSAFNFRFVEGSNHYSNHSLGFAIDINPFYNPYVKGDKILPKEAKKYADRKMHCSYFIKKDDICYQTFIKYGFEWGGEWNSCKDYQHFEKVMNN